MLAQRRDDTRTPNALGDPLDIVEPLGDQAGAARSYHQLGMLAQAGTTTRRPKPYCASPGDRRGRLGDQAGAASGYGTSWAILAQLRPTTRRPNHRYSPGDP